MPSARCEVIAPSIPRSLHPTLERAVGFEMRQTVMPGARCPDRTLPGGSVSSPRRLRLNFHGRVIDHLGIQMYQSPVAAVAEVIANSWDADAETVKIQLPTQLSPSAEIVIVDDGLGMTFQQCQDRYLNVGYNRRGDNPAQTSSLRGRPVLGRKGIGKFAGFGIADAMQITTTSAETGERTTFALDIDRLRGDRDEYVEDDPVEIDVPEYLPADESRRSEHGTTIRLQRLKLRQAPSESVFLQSMARRFLLYQRADDFTVLVNGKSLPQAVSTAAVQFDFPSEYTNAERPQGLVIDGAWGVEHLSTGREVS